MEINDRSWKISTFAEKVVEKGRELYPDLDLKAHFNTIDGWFKDLEKSGVHYIQRSSGEKIYFDLDLDIAVFIMYYRSRNYTLSMIFEMIRSQFDTRAFPPGDRIEELPQYQQEMAKRIKNEVIAGIRESFASEIKGIVQDELEEINFNEMKEYYKQILIEDKKKTFDPESYLKEQKEKELQLAKDMLLIQPKIESELREEALVEWKKKPESERFEKKWFKIKEKEEEKSNYIKQYIEKHREVRVNAWLTSRKEDM